MLCASLTRQDSCILYKEALESNDTGALQRLCREDLFFLILIACKRADINKDWLYDRCREVEANPDGYLDLWAREHYKSTIITFGKTIQDILNNPEVTFGIFSHTRPIAKSFLVQIKRELEINTFLKDLFPEILYQDPAKESPRWSLDDGIVVKRQNNPKESTVEAWGLVDGQPTSKHFSHLIYNDVVTKESVSTPEMIAKVTEAWGLSLNLGSQDCKRRHEGTRYHTNDTYKTIIERDAAIPRIYPATDTGTLGGKPVLLTPQQFENKVRDMGSYVASCHCAKTKILMADWSYKNIEDIQVGENVVGFEIGNGDTRLSLISTKVKAINSKTAEANKYILESGSFVECTPDHKWWTGRSGVDTHKVYSSLGTQKYHELSGLQRISYIEDKLTEEQKLVAQYFAGIFDGEGSVSSKNNIGRGAMTITQSHEHNPEVCEKIEETLKILNIPYKSYIRKAFDKFEKHSKASTTYTILGGRPVKHRLLQWCKFTKNKVVIKSLFGGSGRYSKPNQDKVVSFEKLGKQIVYNLQTESGNYIANGYASKNCQLLQNPLADNLMGFKSDWLSYYDILGNHTNWNFYILVDSASEKKRSSDYTVIVVLGLAPDNNYYLVDGFRDRLNLTERTNKLFELHKKWLPKNTGYEKYGMQSDIEHIKYIQEQFNYRFNIVELGGSMPKNDRIRRLVPIFENHRFYLPHKLLFMGSDGKIHDFVGEFIQFEYNTFPVCSHDDMLDCIARVTDSDLRTMFPKEMITQQTQSTQAAHEKFDVLA